jgi:hypothetical protein
VLYHFVKIEAKVRAKAQYFYSLFSALKCGVNYESLHSHSIITPCFSMGINKQKIRASALTFIVALSAKYTFTLNGLHYIYTTNKKPTPI